MAAHDNSYKILFSHARMVEDLLRSLLYQDLIRTSQLTPAGKLPPVLPVVLYNGSRRWKSRNRNQ